MPSVRAAEPMDATPFLPPESARLGDLATAVQSCRGCPLWEGPEQAEFGDDAYVTNAVKPSSSGAGGRDFRVTRERGQLVASDLSPAVTATIHPSAVLRARSADRDELRASLVADLKVAAKALAKARG